MSGGVDSSVAAHLLLQSGHEVVGVFMRHGENSPVANCTDGSCSSPLLPVLDERPDHKQGCCSASDAEDARRVADRLNIRFYALDLQEEFSRIINYFIDEYAHGRTPNPCVQCNNWLKFGKLFDYADSIGAEYVATGHYARLTQESDGSFALRRGVDQQKDQSYVLFGVEKARLSRMLLPVGEFEKPVIRELAAEVGLRVADKKDSQEICFVTSGKHDEFIRARPGAVETAGEIVTTSGEVVGSHSGIEGFTIGQRRGIGVAMGEPHFVTKIEAETNRVVIGPKEALGRMTLTAKEVNWLNQPAENAFRCAVQFRYNSTAHAATVSITSDSTFEVEFDEPSYGIAPGQAVVCYDGDRVIGGGWIDS
jgi:tRNA-specific 2-thiouridylase